ncbi:cytochrome bd oxidase small subunit, CydX/CbdX family [Dongshaea marina]|nr:cytochrome bd oxidase small subunit, CydX/CbdX family [Dongshaea marina]
MWYITWFIGIVMAVLFCTVIAVSLEQHESDKDGQE